MSSHVIVYLDQNYLSNMAKARAGSIADEDEAKFWLSLFDDLKNAALADKVACPESEFHLTETKYDKRLEEPIIKIINILSGGLQLRPWKSILESQIEDAARQFLRAQLEKRESWSIAFVSDPQCKYSDRIQDVLSGRVRTYIHPSLTSDDIEYDRQLKLGFVGQEEKMLEEYSNSPLGWSELVLQSKRSFMDGFLGKTARQSIAQQAQEDSSLSQQGALDRYNGLVDLFNRLREIGINTDSSKVMDFMESEELLNIPFVDVNASIWAAIARTYQGGKVSKGDFYDVPILASALPYCDIVTTDKSMKKILVNRLHFDDKYKAKIFSATKADRLSFQKLIRGL